jgi:hypothetical protein
MKGFGRKSALGIAVAINVIAAQTAWAGDPRIFDYHGWHIDLTGAPGAVADRKTIGAVKHQLDIVEHVGLKPQVVEFMRTIKIWANPNGQRFGPGHYARATGIDLRLRALVPTKPIILHELLHAYHDQQLPDGFANQDIEKFYDRGKTAGWPADSYMLTNNREFFAVTASVYLFGDIPRPPHSRSQLRARQPRYYEWLAALFDDGHARP